MICFNLVLAALLFAAAAAHPEPEVHYSREELMKREAQHMNRRMAARACAAEIELFNLQRRELRAMAEDDALGQARALPHMPRRMSKRYKDVDTDPYYTELQNTTCVLTPEVTEGPYYIRDEYVRKDLREDQEGITLVLDIGVMDIRTCTPLPDAYVEIWAANATGQYSGFGDSNSGSSNGTGTGQNGTSSSGPPSSNGTSSSTPPSSNGTMASGPPSSNGTMNGSGDSTNSTGGSGSSTNSTGGSGGGMGGGSSQKTNEYNWLRGGYATDDNGIVELYTIYPNYYTGRTNHIHTAVHTNWSSLSNGTIDSNAGYLRHLGQIFFDDDLNSEVLNYWPYSTTTQSRTNNSADSIFEQENSGGYNAFASVTQLGTNISSDGLLAYITIGVDTEADYSFTSTAYSGSD